jgi:hypothetical protein
MSGANEQFPYVIRDASSGNLSLAPMLPINLIGLTPLATLGLVDSGATINVLPFSLGLKLGLSWGSESRPVKLSGNLASVESRAVVLPCAVGNFAPVDLAFAWAESDAVPLILGQMNFFLEFDVCFFRSRGVFEIRSSK